MSKALPVRGFDFHCHLDLFPDPKAAIASCEAARIFTLSVTTTPQAWAQNRQWTAGKRYVHASPGLHPELAGARSDEFVLLERAMTESPFVGEVGLDGSRPHRNTLPAQRDVFLGALRAAERLGGRVVSIHSRRAASEVLDCLAKNTTVSRVLPILHWFSDGISLARRAAEQGCYFSVNHRMLAGDSGVAVVQSLPFDKLLTETDAPFTDLERRKSEPQDVVATTELLAQVRGVSVAEISAQLRANAARVFSFAGLEGLLVP